MSSGLVRGIGSWCVGILWPHVCPRCGRQAPRGGILCEGCRNEALSRVSNPATPAGIEALACGPELTPPLRELVHGLKYNAHRRAARALVELASPSVPPDFWRSGSVLVPVPLHRNRLRERGYNQSALLADAWSRQAGISVAKDWLARMRDTGTQTKLGASERSKNLGMAFALGPGFRQDVDIYLVDDVLTTGSTLSACASVLLAGGAKSVRAVCIGWAGEA